MTENKFALDYSKRLSKCQKCKKEMAKGEVRLAKIVPNFFGGEGDNDNDAAEMKQYHHIDCLFDSFKRAKATTKIIESADDIRDFALATDADKKKIVKAIKEIEGSRKKKPSTAVGNKPAKKPVDKDEDDDEEEDDDDEDSNDEAKPKTSSQSAVANKSSDSIEDEADNEDNTFQAFQTVCERIADESGHLKKTEILTKFFSKGINSTRYKGNKYLFLKLLLPASDNRVYNLESKSLIKNFSRIFNTDLDEMSDHLNKGDVAETLRHFFAKSEDVAPSKTSTLTLAQVDTYLTKLTQVSGDEQIRALTSLVRKCTRNDLRMFIRLVKKDLRINAGTKVIMDALGPNAYQAFQVSRDLKDVVARVDKLDSNGKPGMKKDLSIKVNLMTAVKPMLADACKSVERAFQKCPNGLYAEIKYDGERLQVHKNNAKFSYYSRNLKEVQAHKVEHLKEYIPKAFATASQLILDGEILLYCNETKKPLPFGTLGVHKKNKFTTATVCYVVFDCLHINGKDLTNTPLAERRRLLVENMEEIPGRIMLSEQHLFKKPAALRELMMNVIEEGLEGLVCKDTQGKYEPGKRHWLKMKRDYLEDGSMADTADLVVLGAYYGTGNKGGMRSVFLMGCLCEKTGKWYTVTKVGNGLDDAALEKMQKKIDMVEIKKRPEAVPSWLVVNRSLVPDFVVKDPKKSMVWELTGAEFSKSDSHTADGISIRFPRITKVRDDKSWKEATSLQRLKKLVATSKEKSDLIDSSSPSKRKSTEAERNDSDEDDDIKEVKEVKKFKTASASTSTASSSKKKSTLDEDDDESSKKKSSKKQQSDDLPSLFNGKTFYFCEDVPNTADLFRYVNYNGGEVVSSKAAAVDATHVVVLDESAALADFLQQSAVKIGHEKLWECIKTKKAMF